MVPLISRIQNRIVFAIEKFAGLEALSYLSAHRYSIAFTSLFGVSILGTLRSFLKAPIACSSEDDSNSNTTIVKSICEPVCWTSCFLKISDLFVTGWTCLTVLEHQDHGRIVESSITLTSQAAQRERMVFFLELVACALAKSVISGVQLWFNNQLFARNLDAAHFTFEEQRDLRRSRNRRTIAAFVPSLLTLVGVLTLYPRNTVTADERGAAEPT
mmetsp:Transcript_4145/g.15629  ORF Transcript_4145/g.15629 Transcript_4145/m.15629 type:complete len:215 (-) Transcript_4145:1048-1692(-)|eukprot:CAMPEP_0117438312 /NCGR_PEP_ID=MMETSP0759-20121206/1988_1 /TAXON_ID=63605 /ORGANISM="Percolomonas cosmopolitus, Strain WS" /LENGTH=214 /DNA_ID=CAMNT_0005229999 /DNA_START=170 /DNA_END=814 /DNA_ORIENTATION=+